MKSLIFLSILLCSTSLFAQYSPGIEEPILEEIPIFGQWWMDTTYFVNDGVQGEGSTPILPTSWTLSEDGSMFIENASQIFASFELTDDHLLVEMLGMIMDYTILELTDNTMRLMNTIYETDTGSLRTLSILRRRE